MNIANAINKKCPLSFNPAMNEFNYCQTSICMAWNGDDEQGFCILLKSKCSHEKKDTE
ncbi:MAG: hypothetical protein WA126_08655 [Thermodesulfovibrionales bacterium]